mgnify:CR=1 FL=1
MNDTKQAPERELEPTITVSNEAMAEIVLEGGTGNAGTGNAGTGIAEQIVPTEEVLQSPDASDIEIKSGEPMLIDVEFKQYSRTNIAEMTPYVQKQVT